MQKNGNSQKITITNDSGRLTKEQIDRMIADADKFRSEDMKNVDRMSARNKLESYLYNVKVWLGLFLHIHVYLFFYFYFMR